MDDDVPDQGMASDLGVTEEKFDEDDEKLDGSTGEMIIRGSLEDNRPFSV